MSEFAFECWLLNLKGLLKPFRKIVVALCVWEYALSFHCNQTLHIPEFLLCFLLFFSRILWVVFECFVHFYQNIPPSCLSVILKILVCCKNVIDVVFAQIQLRDLVQMFVELEVFLMSANVGFLICIFISHWNIIPPRVYCRRNDDVLKLAQCRYLVNVTFYYLCVELIHNWCTVLGIWLSC